MHTWDTLLSPGSAAQGWSEQTMQRMAWTFHHLYRNSRPQKTRLKCLTAGSHVIPSQNESYMLRSSLSQRHLLQHFQVLQHWRPAAEGEGADVGESCERTDQRTHDDSCVAIIVKTGMDLQLCSAPSG